MPLAAFPPSVRLKEQQTKHTSLIPTEATTVQEISWQDFRRSHAPRGASKNPAKEFCSGDLNKNPVKDFCSGDFDGVCRRCRLSLCAVVKWLVGPYRTSNRATNFFIRLGDNWRC